MLNNKVLYSFIYVIIFFSFFLETALAFSGSGSGTSGSPYQITSCAQLHEIDSDLDADYLVMNDINCNGFSFSPIGDTTSNFFTGTLDGDGHKITNLNINSNANGIGIFATLGTGGLITDIGYESGSVTSGEDVVSMGSFAGNVSGGSITNSYSKATLDGSAAAFIDPVKGGLIGKGDSATISNSYYSGNITASALNPNYTAGIAGYLSAGSITNSYSTGSTTNGQNVGGLTGRMFSSSTITNSFSTMTFTNASQVGALVGTITSGTISNGYWNDTSGGFFTCYFGGNTGCTRISNNIPYFYTITNTPMSSWDFNDVWSRQNNGTGYPLLNWQAPNPTPTPTASSSSISTNPVYHPPSTTNPPSCGDLAPTAIPNLFQVDAGGNFVNLYFSTTPGVSGYNVNYGLSPDANQYGDNFGYSGSLWIMQRMISGLSPNTTYYFKVQAVKGCNAGLWSPVKEIRTKGVGFVTSSGQAVAGVSKSPDNCSYTVKEGDSFWKIASEQLGSGVKSGELQNLNLGVNILQIGQTVSICK